MKQAGTYLIGLLVAVHAWAATPPSFQDLMKPECLAHAQFGMRVESARLDGAQLRIVTTGAEFGFDRRTGRGAFRQRIGSPREVLQIHIDGAFAGRAELTHSGPGVAFARFESPRFDLRANGDSLFMFHAIEPLRMKLIRSIEPGFVASHKANHLVVDEYGGFGLYCSVPDIPDHFDPFDVEAGSGSACPVVTSYELPADAVLWIAICPPRPYDWERSAADHVIWHWSDKQAYPPDDVLTGWAKLGNIVLLQSEVMLWKDWNLAFEPRLGQAEFARVRETVHRLGMRFIVYTSPYYFLRGTAKESIAMNSFENFKGWPIGTANGENIELFLREIDKVMKEYQPDGLYFDGQYIENPAALYLLARRARGIVGDRGILEWHSTQALGPDLCSLPAADAYVDYILRGEGRQMLYGDDDYLRYFVSGYNVHNSIGVLCNNGQKPSPELVGRLLDVNGRMHTLAGWMNDPQLVKVTGDYRRELEKPRVVEERVHRVTEQRQAVIPARVKAYAEEQRSLAREPQWGKPVLSEEFDSLQGWKQTVSPLNPDALSVSHGLLRISARAHTFAYVERPIHRPVTGCVFKIRRGSDAGMSWGPAVCIRWSDQDLLRVGLRCDGLIQADVSGDQRLAGTSRPDEYVWLRARWTQRAGVIEQSGDGRTFSRILAFQHAGRFAGPADRLLVGKVPYDGKSHDYPESGLAGVSEIGSLTLY